VAFLANAAVFLAVEVALLAAGRTVVWVEVDIDTAAHLPGERLVLAEVVDIPAGKADMAGSVVGIAEVEVDLPYNRSWKVQ